MSEHEQKLGDVEPPALSPLVSDRVVAMVVPPVTPVGSYAQSAANAVLDVLTLVAAIATKPKETAFSAIRLIRSATAGRFSEQLREEWSNYVAAGKIKPDYADTDQARAIFADTLQSFEDANFDEEQLELLRKLFLAAASETVTDRHNALVREYIEVGRTLATGEIRVLAAYHRYLPEWERVRDEIPLHAYPVQRAHEVARRSSGLEYVGLIDRHEQSLIQKGLVRPQRVPHSGSANVDSKLFRLTDFGLAFCEFVATYDRLKEE